MHIKRLIPVIIIVALLALGAYMLLSNKAVAPEEGIEATSTPTAEVPNTDIPAESRETFTDPSLAVSFNYPSSYTVVETTEGGGELVRFVSLYDKEEWNDFQSTEGSDGPPAITYAALDAADATDPRVWVESSRSSNYQLSGTAVGMTTIDGALAFRYRYDGLYAAEAVAVILGDIAHVFTVSYPDRDDPIVDDFEELVQSINFSSEVQGE